MFSIERECQFAANLQDVSLSEVRLHDTKHAKEQQSNRFHFLIPTCSRGGKKTEFAQRRLMHETL